MQINANNLLKSEADKGFSKVHSDDGEKEIYDKMLLVKAVKE